MKTVFLGMFLQKMILAVGGILWMSLLAAQAGLPQPDVLIYGTISLDDEAVMA